MDGLIIKFAGAVPETGESASHVWSLLPEKVSVPVPVFVTLKPSGETDVPVCAVKLKLVALTARTGVVAGGVVATGGAVVIWPVTPEP
jgi:hypothetical protein